MTGRILLLGLAFLVGITAVRAQTDNHLERGGPALPASAPLTAALELRPDEFEPGIMGYSEPIATRSVPRPPGILREPPYRFRPFYGVLPPVGLGGKPTLFVIDESTDFTQATLYVDTNQDGDLTNDPPAKWEYQSYEGDKYRQYSGTCQLREGGGALVTAALDRIAQRRDYVRRFSRWLREGPMTFPDGRTYPIRLHDMWGTGRYDLVGPHRPDTKSAFLHSPNIVLEIDQDGDGQISEKYERYDLAKPFTLDGVTYELDSVSADGSRLTLRPSKARNVFEVATLRLGSRLPPFTVKSLYGGTIRWPADFRGKVVLLDAEPFTTTFNARTGEDNNVIRYGAVRDAYARYHARGFEVLGICGTKQAQPAQVKRFLQGYQVRWPCALIPDDFKGPITSNFIESGGGICISILVDGDTGTILAHEGNLVTGFREDGGLFIQKNLAARVEAALASKAQ